MIDMIDITAYEKIIAEDVRHEEMIAEDVRHEETMADDNLQ